MIKVMYKKSNQSKTKSLIACYLLLVLSLFFCTSLYSKEQKDTFTIGGCMAVEHSGHLSLGRNNLEPLGWVANAIWRFDNNHRQQSLKANRDSAPQPVLFSKNYSIKILQYPKNGKLTDDGATNNDPANFYYVAKDNFLGKDKVVYLIEDDQYKIKYVQNLVVIENVGDDSSEENCIDTRTQYLITQPRNPVPIPEQAVMKRDIISVSNFYNKDKKIKFVKNQIIDYIQVRNGNALLVDDDGEKIAWMPLSATITTEQFSKLNSWQGKSTISYCSDSVCEGKGVSLKFKLDGTFYDESYPKNKGHLYHYQDFIWAKNGNVRRFDLHLFKKTQNNNLCAMLTDSGSVTGVTLMSATADDGVIDGCE